MSEDLVISGASKAEQYESFTQQLTYLLADTPNPLTQVSQLLAALQHGFGFLWTGIYQVHGDQLVLGPFQGPIACVTIARGRGVCGTAWHEARTLVVPDVDAFPGHIACSSASRSEIVLPVFRGQEVIAVLDIDSAELGTFDEVDQRFLEEIVATYLAPCLPL
ncbi:GAF domain-containing protein [Salinispirillum sp. LH 10-3-1]|uniref:GAF domain-containing protein n=1 Tax=Salinispirillum sp. LH 10-3-1 TaxID=2952525 RepID=A0AB38YHB9_9GAMM